MKVLFQMFDINDDGYIQTSELLFILKFLHKINPQPNKSPEDQCNEIMTKWDVDGNGELSKTEFLAGFTHFPHLNDTVKTLSTIIAKSFRRFWYIKIRKMEKKELEKWKKKE